MMLGLIAFFIAAYGSEEVGVVLACLLGIGMSYSEGLLQACQGKLQQGLGLLIFPLAFIRALADC
jgi:hypothetical protein